MIINYYEGKFNIEYFLIKLEKKMKCPIYYMIPHDIIYYDYVKRKLVIRRIPTSFYGIPLCTFFNLN